MSAKKRPGAKPPGLSPGMDLGRVFNATIRLRAKGQARSATKTKRQRAANERAFQRELKRIASTVIPELPKADKLPESKIFKTPKKRSRLAALKERLGGGKSTQT